MTVEDHPQWPEWNAAFERMKAAWDAFAYLRSLGGAPSHPSLKSAWQEFQSAAAAYELIANNLDENPPSSQGPRGKLSGSAIRWVPEQRLFQEKRT